MKNIKITAIMLLVILTGTFLFTNETVVQAQSAEDLRIENGIFIGGIDVSGMHEEEAVEAVSAYVDSLQSVLITLAGPNDNVQLTFGDMGLTADIESAVEEALEAGHSGNLIQRFKHLQDLESENLHIDMGLHIDKQMVAQALYEKSDKMNIPSIDNGLKKQNGSFVYVEGQEGNEVDIVTSVNLLSEWIAGQWELGVQDSTEFVLNSVISAPRGTEEELAAVKDLLGTCTTSYSSSGSGRAKNVETGTAKINGTMLYPGDEISVYQLTHPFTKENGYELAGSYSNGTTVESFGGGICQVSTTLYNAVLNAELEITQRYNHSMTVSYVDLAADAAIAGTYKDLRFKNNYDFPIYIEGICSNRKLTFNVYGVETRAQNRTVTYESELISKNDPDTEYTLSDSMALGTYKQTRSKHIGYVAKLWKVVKVDGVEQERTQVNKSTYQASAKQIVIGTAGATSEQLAAIQSALATKDEAHIKAVVAGMKVQTPAVPEEPNTAETPSASETPGASDGNTQTPADSETPSTGDSNPADGNNSETIDIDNSGSENSSTENSGSDNSGSENTGNSGSTDSGDADSSNDGESNGDNRL